jgi:hypothetical protein
MRRDMCPTSVPFPRQCSGFVKESLQRKLPCTKSVRRGARPDGNDSCEARAALGGVSLLSAGEKQRLYPTMPIATIASRPISPRAPSHYSSYLSPRAGTGQHHQRLAAHQPRSARDPRIVARCTPISQLVLPGNYILPGTAAPTFRQYPAWRHAVPRVLQEAPLQRARQLLELEPAEYFGSTLRVRDYGGFAALPLSAR